MPCHTRHSLRESLRRANLITPLILAIVESERLFIYVSEQVKRLHGNVCTVQSAFQQRPKVLKSVRVNCPVNVLFKMVNDLVRVLAGNCIRIGDVLICVNQRTSVNHFRDASVKGILLAVRGLLVS
jgi:hypothetical protein